MASADSCAAAAMNVPNRTIDLRKGHPKPSNLPSARIMMAMAMASKRLEANQLSLQYPPSYYGMPHFLKNLREFLHSAYNHNVFEDGLFTTNGVSHGLELCCATFTKPGDVVWIETPSYFLAHQVFLDHHLKVKGMPIDAQGLDTDELKILLEAANSQGNLPRMLYIVPSHGNPSGTVLPMERRVALLALARQYNFLVITDDVYHMLDWSDKLLGFDCGGQQWVSEVVMPCGTLSGDARDRSPCQTRSTPTIAVRTGPLSNTVDIETPPNWPLTRARTRTAIELRRSVN